MTTIIIVSFNRWDLVEKCLDAADKFLPRNSEIILVDNASTEDIPGKVKKQFPQVKVIANKNNLGFAVANNQGMNAARGDYFLLLNTDAFLAEGAITKMEDFFRTHPDAGIVGAQLQNKDGTTQPSGGYFPDLARVFLLMTFIDNLPWIKKYIPSIHIRYRPFFNSVQKIDWVAGAFFMVRKEVFVKTGGFDETIFMYGEELEWCYRATMAGFKIYLNPEVKITHLGFASSRSESYGIIKEMESFVYFYRKYKPAWQLPILVTLLFLGSLLRVIRGIITLRPELVRTYSSAFPAIIKKAI